MALARTRLIFSALAGAVVGGVTSAFAPWEVGVLAGWIAAAAVWVVRILVAVLPLDPMHTKQLATREDNSRFLSDAIILGASLASLIGVGFGVAKASSQDGVAQAVTTVATVLTVMSAWSVVQVTFMLRYARLFCSAGKGVDFNEDGGEGPDYRDFLYLAVTIGMAYQVSDTDLTTKDVRRTATRHALFSYVFGTVIVAITINIVASLVGG